MSSRLRHPRLSRLSLAAAAVAAATAVPVGLAHAAEPRDPLVLELPSGQGISIVTEPFSVSGQTGAKDSPANQLPEFSVDLLLFMCGNSIATDGTVWCGVDGKPSVAPVPPPAPTPAPTPAPPRPAPSSEPTAGPEGDGSGDEDNSGNGDGSSSTAGRPEPAPGPNEGVDPDPVAPGSEGQPVAAGGPSGSSSDSSAGGSGPAAAEPLSTQELLDLGVSTFALLTLVGGAGVAAASAKTWRRRSPAAAEGAQGSVLFADNGSYAFDPDVAGPGDRSRWWRLLSGWLLLDRLSRLVPTGLATRAPLVARIAADGSYLRAVLGAGWVVLPATTFALGLSAAHDAEGYPLAPGLVLTAALVCLAVLDATAGLAGVIGFALGLLIWGPGDLGFAPGLRGFLGLAALWFAIPLIASTARPLRRTRERTALYVWDRLGDGLIAALIAGWAVQGAVTGLPGLSGRQSPVDPYADRLALIAIAAVAFRVALEEVAARFFPERLRVVDTGVLPDPSTARSLISAVLRTGVFLFVAYPFIGNCWQLWVGGMIFAVPQLLSAVVDRLPNSEALFQVLPRGVAGVLFMILVGLGAANLVESMADGDVVQNAFVLLALPGLVVSVLSLLGREGPVPERSWRNEVLGALVVAASVALVV